VTRILLRAGKSPLQPLSPEASLGFGRGGVFGTNVGNIAFSDAMFRLLNVPGSEVVPNAYLTERGGLQPSYFRRINEEFDAFVVPLANAFRPAFMGALRSMTAAIEALKIPVVVVGVGAQGRLGEGTPDNPELDGVVAAFMRAVLDRSAKVGVRGDVTRQYLAGLGFGDEHVEVIGCPAVYLRDVEGEVRKPVAQLGPDALLSLTLSPYVRAYERFFNRAVKAYPKAIYVPQRAEDLELMLWGHQFALSASPKLPVHTAHPLYTQDRMRFFCDSRPWLDFHAGRDFTIGTRIHGTIMSLVAGTPATLIAHDSRTLELAEYHEIPYRTVSSLTDQDSPASIYAASDFGRFNAGKASRFAALLGFLEANGLEHVAMPGKANPEFEAQWQAAPLAEPVHTLYGPDDFRGTLIRRLDWLHQSTADAVRQADRYRPPVAGRADGRNPTDFVDFRELHELARRVRRLEHTMDRLAGPLSLRVALVRRLRRLRRGLRRQA
jgi:hypothetical protein